MQPQSLKIPHGKAKFVTGDQWPVVDEGEKNVDWKTSCSGGMQANDLIYFLFH